MEISLWILRIRSKEEGIHYKFVKGMQNSLVYS